MRYLLVFMCDVCDAQGKGRLLGPGAAPPDGWAHRRWPDGRQSLVCSPRCAKEIGKKMSASSILRPRPLPLVRGRNVTMALRR